MKSQSHTKESGFTLIEILMTIMLIGILSMVSIGYFYEDLEEQRFDATVAELNTIKEAIIGKDDLTEDGKRVNFGFLGDIGAIPDDLLRLIDDGGTLSAYTLNTTGNIRHGWNGSYIEDNSGDNSVLTDAWGRAYVYSTGSDPVTIVSLGADGVAGGVGLDQDITISIPVSSTKATVTGVITSGGEPYTSTADVVLYAPNGTTGAIATTTDSVTAPETGYFSFSNVPYGQRAIIIYIPNSGSPTTTIGPIPITVDRPNYTVSTEAIAIPGANSPCIVTPDIVYSSDNNISGSSLTLAYTRNSAVSVSSVNISWQDAQTTARVNSFTLDGMTYNVCPGEFSPCTIENGTTVTLAAADAISGSGNMVINFSTNMSSQAVAILLTYTTGSCSLLYFAM